MHRPRYFLSAMLLRDGYMPCKIWSLYTHTRWGAKVAYRRITSKVVTNESTIYPILWDDRTKEVLDVNW